MALIIEDGTIVANADSYVTLAAYQAYGAARGWTLGTDDAADEINLRRAFDGINRQWSYRGELVNEATQAGAWPRYMSAFSSGYVVPSNEIPQRVKDAQCELAYLVQGGLDLFATIGSSTTSEMIKVGPITIDEETLPSGKARVVAVEGLLRPYLGAGAGQIALVRG